MAHYELFRNSNQKKLLDLETKYNKMKEKYDVLFQELQESNARSSNQLLYELNDINGGVKRKEREIQKLECAIIIAQKQVIDLIHQNTILKQISISLVIVILGLLIWIKWFDVIEMNYFTISAFIFATTICIIMIYEYAENIYDLILEQFLRHFHFVHRGPVIDIIKQD